MVCRNLCKAIFGRFYQKKQLVCFEGAGLSTLFLGRVRRSQSHPDQRLRTGIFDGPMEGPPLTVVPSPLQNGSQAMAAKQAG
jgi:hypothetical protein